MKFDNIIIGGGLSGLVSGIALAEAGKKTAIIAAGQSTLHFASGSFDLLGYDAEGKMVENPLEAIAKLDAAHPYQKIGAENIKNLAAEAQALLQKSGLKIKGSAEKNHYRITPMGVLKPTWLTLEDYQTADNAASFPYKKVVLANIAGFLDFPMEFIEAGLKKLGVEVEAKIVSIPALQDRRHSPSEMRSANISKVLSSEETLQLIADKLNNVAGEGIEAILMPAIVGLNNEEALESLKAKVTKPLSMIATLPPSVPGVRVQTMLRKYFEKLGGTFMLGNTVTAGKIADGKLAEIETSALADEKLVADNYILATGSFQSGGLKSNYVKVYEPIFGLDVDAAEARTEWIDENVYNAQPYMTFGVKTNNALQVQKDGQVIDNLYAVGAVLSGHNAIKAADGTGVDLISALAAAKSILNK